MKKTLLLLPLLVIGCARPAATVQLKEADKSAAVVVKDLRPASEQVHEFFSLMITSDAYGIAREGDDRTAPQPVRILQHRVFEKLGAANQPLNLTVHHFVIYSNGAAQFRHGAMGAALGGAIGGALASRPGKGGNTIVSSVDAKAFEALEKEEYKRGLYTEAENPTKTSVNIVYIDAEINGKRTFIRLMAPHGGSSHATGQNLANTIGEAVEGGIQAFLEAY